MISNKLIGKTSYLFRISWTIFIFLCLGCSKEPVEPKLNYSQYIFTNGKIEARIDGDLFTFPTVPAHSYPSGTVSINGKSCKDNLAISIMFTGSLGTNELNPYDLFDGVLELLQNCNRPGYSETKEYMIEEGYLTVTENSEERVKGTFYFNCINRSGATKTITDGLFDVRKSQINM